jgi:transposase-like protein
VSVLVAIGVNAAGYREVLGVAEGLKEDHASWLGFLRHLKARGLAEVQWMFATQVRDNPVEPVDLF